MIKLAIITRDENHLQQIINRLRREKDMNFLSTIIVKNPESEGEQVLAFLKLMIEQRPDIFLLEQALLRDMAALDLERILNYRDKMPNMKIIIFGIRFNEENVVTMMQGGVRGFFRISLGDEQLVKCIRLVAKGDICLETELITPVFNEFIKESMKQRDLIQPLTDLSSEKLKMLSPREMEVMELISHSMTNEEIADKLFLSPKTVKTHIRNIFEKSGIRNRVEAALLYARHALNAH
jgi:two-component system, NarL family, response regulator DegU